jgi:predicted SAM-dependent methyltransferase
MMPAGHESKLRFACAKLLYWGRRYRCPLCSSDLRTFLPFGARAPVFASLQVVGGGYRRNARCPICQCLDRERLVYLTLLRVTDAFEKHTRVLHVAPELQLSEILKKQGTVDYVTADLHSTQVMVKMDISTIQFPDEVFDGIVCNHVLEHIVDDGRAMAELYRVLRPKGWAILQVPISLALDHTYEDFSITTPRAREAAFGQHDHVRIYARDYKDRLEHVGFKVNVIRWTARVHDFGGPRNRFGLNEKESVYLATK